MAEQKKYASALIAVTGLFFMWGLITVLVDAMVPRLKDIFELSNFKAGLVQLAWFLAYFIFSIPAGFLLRKVGYKKGIIAGLAVMGLGCLIFYPAAELRFFPVFLFALFVVAGGMALLQVAANPYISALGPESSASSRLNLAQAFNSVGTTIAPILSAAYLLSDNIKTSAELEELPVAEKSAYFASEASAVQGPFVLLAVVLAVLVLIFLLVKLPAIKSAKIEVPYNGIFRFPHLWMAALGIFVYVGAEVAIGSFLTNYFVDMGLAAEIKANSTLSWLVDGCGKLFKGTGIDQMDAKGIMGVFVTFYWGGAMVGRFLGSVLTRKIEPAKVLSLFSLGSIAMLALTMSTSGLTAMWAAVSVGFFNSIMFPTIFTMGIKRLGDYQEYGSGILCTAIVGGAIIPPLYGKLADVFGLTSDSATGYKLAYLLPILCYLYILIYGFWFRRYERKLA
jgi:MFS transporter, FHS family, L-fucose permease